MTLHNEEHTRRTHWAEFASCSSASLPWREWELLLNEMLPITTHHYRPVRSIPFSEPSAVVCFASWVLHTAGAPGRSWDASFPLQARYNTVIAEVTQCSSQWQKYDPAHYEIHHLSSSVTVATTLQYGDSHNMVNSCLMSSHVNTLRLKKCDCNFIFSPKVPTTWFKCMHKLSQAQDQLATQTAVSTHF